MYKNEASQIVGAQMVTAADGTAFTGSVTVAVTGDGGTQATGSVGSGACTHEGNGFHSYAPAQAETNYDHVAYTFTGTGAIPATLQVYPKARASSILFVDFGGVPSVIVTPKTGTDTFDMRFESRDHNNQLVAPDSVTVTLVDQDGTDLSSRLDDTTPAAVSTGLYEIVYTATAADAAAQLKLGVTLTKSGYVGDKQHYSINLVDAAALVNANVTQVNGTSQTAYDIGANLGAPVGEESISAMILSNTGIGQSIESDTQDIQSRLPAALTGAGNIKADALAVSGSATAADNAEVVFDTDFASNYNTTADKWNASVTHFNGTAGTFASGLPDVNVRTHQGHRTWYVAPSGGNDSNAGTLAAPLATVAQAITNHKKGDTIRLMNGSWSTGMDLSNLADVIIEGEGEGTVVTATSPLKLTDCNNVTVRNIKLVSNDTGSLINGLHALRVANLKVEGCYITGNYDAAIIDTCRNFLIKNTYLFGTFDAITCPASQGVIDNSWLETDGTYSTGGLRKANCLVAVNGHITVINSTLKVQRDVENTLDAACVGAGTLSADDDPHIVLMGCRLLAYQTVATSTGDALGIGYASTSQRRYHATVINCSIRTRNDGEGDSIDIDASRADSESNPSSAVVINSSVDAAKVTSGVTFIDGKITATLADTAEMQGDLADGGRLDLILDATLADTADIQPKIGTPDTDLAADIAAIDTAVAAINPSTETRDLAMASKANQWDMVQRSGGVVSLNPITIYQGETKKLSFNLSKIMASGDVLATMGTPTASDGDLTPTKLGIGPTWANLTLAAAADTTAGTGYTVRVTVTTDEGDGPILLIGNVTVLDD